MTGKAKPVLEEFEQIRADILERLFAGVTEEEFQKAKEANWKVSMGGILGDCSCRDGYSVRFENCTYDAERGIGNSELPDIE